MKHAIPHAGLHLPVASLPDVPGNYVSALIYDRWTYVPSAQAMFAPLVWLLPSGGEGGIRIAGNDETASASASCIASEPMPPVAA